MLFEPKDNSQEKEDFFDGPDIPEQPKAPKKPAYKPEDPAYWEEDESEWEHLRPRKRWKVRLWAGCVLVVILLVVACWRRYFSPYV